MAADWQALAQKALDGEAGGREVHLRTLQPLGLYAASSLFAGDYLTTKGQEAAADYQMIEDLGFEIEACAL